METLLLMWFVAFIYLFIGGYLLLYSDNKKDQKLGSQLILTGLFFPVAFPIWIVYAVSALWKKAFSEAKG